MIYVPFSSRTLENYLEDLSPKQFFIFSSDFNCYALERLRGGEREAGENLLWYIGIHMENIFISHTSDSIECAHLYGTCE